jgi:hypothetical protein
LCDYLEKKEEEEEDQRGRGREEQSIVRDSKLGVSIAIDGRQTIN